MTTDATVVAELTVGDLRAACAGLPDAMPVALLDDLSVDPLGSTAVLWWRYSGGFGIATPDRDTWPDGDSFDPGDSPDNAAPVRALILAAGRRSAG